MQCLSDSDNDNDNYLSDKVIVSEEVEEDEDISSNSDDLHTSSSSSDNDDNLLINDDQKEETFTLSKRLDHLILIKLASIFNKYPVCIDMIPEKYNKIIKFN